jgi:hypothetical protein
LPLFFTFIVSKWPTKKRKNKENGQNMPTPMSLQNKRSYSKRTEEICHNYGLNDCFSVGYQALVNHFHLKVISLYCASFVSASVKRKIVKKKEDQEIHVYPLKYFTPDLGDTFHQLLFALKYEGINLEILRSLFNHLSRKDVACFIRKSRFSKEMRKMWYLYEGLTGSICELPDMTKGRYYKLLDVNKYYTSRAKNSHRHRIVDNLLGNLDFSPVVRRTRTLINYEKKDLAKRAQKLLKKFARRIPKLPLIFQSDNLGIKSREDNKLEQMRKKRHERFVAIIKEAEQFRDISKKGLISLHNKATGRGFFERDFRKHQNYLAYDHYFTRHKICRISPRPKDVPLLVQCLIDTIQKMKNSSVHPVIIAAVSSFGFSIIHPFGDGNGRVQLFLLYHALLHSDFRPVARIFCHSLTNFFYLPDFNKTIEPFDRALLSFIKFTLHRDTTLTVHGKTLDFYRYIDCTKMVEFLFSCLEDELDKISN